MSPVVSPATLAHLQLTSLYSLDGRGRIVDIREPDPPAAPRLHLIRTPEGPLAAVHQDLPEHTARELLQLAGDEPWPDDVRSPPAHAEAYRELLGRLAPVTRQYAGPCFVLEGPFPADSRPTRITASNVTTLPPDFEPDGRNVEARSLMWAVIEGAAAVSIAMSARDPARALHAGVYTLEAHRGRGLGIAVTAAWSADVTASGHIPLYGTTWDNVASRHIAARLGGRYFGVEYWLG